MSREIQWKCQYEDSLIQPPRGVLDLSLIHISAIRMDGVEVLRSNYYTYFENVWTNFHHLRSTTLKDRKSTRLTSSFPCDRGFHIQNAVNCRRRDVYKRQVPVPPLWKAPGLDGF